MILTVLAPALIAAAPIVFGAINTVVGVLGAAGVFTKDPDVPSRDDPGVEDARRRALLRQRRASGIASTRLTGVLEGGDPLSQRPRLLGGNRPVAGGPQPGAAGSL
jgi:hypothetical protein